MKRATINGRQRDDIIEALRRIAERYGVSLWTISKIGQAQASYDRRAGR